MSERWTLSDDRERLRIVRGSPEGTYTSYIDFKRAATDEDVQKAVAMCGKWRLDPSGEKRIGKRWRTRRGYWWYFHIAGPPTWWFPRLLPERWGLGFGWFRSAWSFTWKRESGPVRDQERAR